MVPGKNLPGKNIPVRVKGRVRVRLRIGLGLESGGFFSRGDFFLEPFKWFFIIALLFHAFFLTFPYIFRNLLETKIDWVSKKI